MTPDERELLSGLFQRIAAASGTPRDREAEAFIADAVRAQPAAPYLMAQTVLVQEEALNAATARIQELEARVAGLERERQQPTSFLGGIGKSLFGDDTPRRTGSGVPAMGQGQPVQPPGGAWGRPPMPGPGGAAYGQPQMPWDGQPGAAAGGGFLRSAMATAAGVAGGALLFSGIQSLMQSHGSGLIPPDGASALAGSGLGGGLAGTGLDDPNLMGTQSNDVLAGGHSDPLDSAHFEDGDTGDNLAGDFDTDMGDGGDWA